MNSLLSRFSAKLNDEFPRKMQLHDLRKARPDFSSLPEEEWLIAMDALIKLGRAQAGTICYGMGDGPEVIANIEITAKGRDYLERPPHISDGQSGEVDDLLPIFAKRQFEKDIATLSACATISAPLSLLFVDLDRFKSVNDSFGHLVGNEVLVETAKALKSTCEKRGPCYRWGGEELAVLLPNHNLSEAEVLSERVRDAIRKTEFKNYPHRMTASVGVSSYPETSGNAEALVNDADRAMLEAKEAGRDRVCLAPRASERAQASEIPQLRLSSAEIAKRVDAAQITASIESGRAANFLIQVQNDSDDEIAVKEIQLLSKNEILLTQPARQPEKHLWRLPSTTKLLIGWCAQPDPVRALVNMNSQKGALFETELKITFPIEVLGRTKRCECKLWVRVDAFQSKIIHLAG